MNAEYGCKILPPRRTSGAAHEGKTTTGSTERLGKISRGAAWLLAATLLLAGCGGGGGAEDGGVGNGGSSDLTFTVTATAGTGGTISPVSQTVTQGATGTLTVTPDTGYIIESVIGCNGTLDGNSYTTGPVTANCAVSATFTEAGGAGDGGSSDLTFTVTAAAGTGGTISPVSQTVTQGATGTLTVTPDTGYIIESVIGCNGTLDGATYTTGPITANCAVNATFSESTAPPAGAPAAPQVTINYGIKQLQFSWEAIQGATYYKLLENPDGASGYSQVGSNFVTTAISHPIALYDRVNARYQVEACNNVGCTASSDIFIADGIAGAIGYFKASNPGEDSFGSVAISGDGTTLAVGAPGESSASVGVNSVQTDNSALNSGAVYVFVRSAGGWSQQAYIKASNTDAGDYFGGRVSLSSDGNTLAVGAWGEASAVYGDPTDNSRTFAGAAYVFTRSGTMWSQQAYLKPSNTTSIAFEFGLTLQLTADGNTLAVGAPQESSAAAGINGDQTTQSRANTGAVYVFVRSGSAWSQQAYIKASNPDTYDYFGWSVAISHDGDTLAVGAEQEDSAATTINGDQSDDSATDRGAVYVFFRSGATWVQQAYVKSTVEGDAEFGTAVAISGDGNTLAAAGYRSGTVHLFRRSGTVWSQAATETPGRHPYLSMSADGRTLAVGTLYDASNATGLNGDETDNSLSYSGAVHLYSWNGSTLSRKAYIKAPNTGGADYFGPVALSANGDTLAVGASGEDGATPGICATAEPTCVAAQGQNSVSDAGAVYLY